MPKSQQKRRNSYGPNVGRRSGGLIGRILARERLLGDIRKMYNYGYRRQSGAMKQVVARAVKITARTMVDMSYPYFVRNRHFGSIGDVLVRVHKYGSPVPKRVWSRYGEFSPEHPLVREAYRAGCADGERRQYNAKTIIKLQERAE